MHPKEKTRISETEIPEIKRGQQSKRPENKKKTLKKCKIFA